jgi:hypothetical protein
VLERGTDKIQNPPRVFSVSACTELVQYRKDNVLKNLIVNISLIIFWYEYGSDLRCVDLDWSWLSIVKLLKVALRIMMPTP